MRRILILAGIAVCATTASLFAGDGRQTFRDAQGRNMGSATTDRNGKTTYRDSMGRVQGTSTTDSSGKTTYRDAQGRVQGSKR